MKFKDENQRAWKSLSFGLVFRALSDMLQQLKYNLSIIQKFKQVNLDNNKHNFQAFYLLQCYKNSCLSENFSSNLKKNE